MEGARMNQTLSKILLQMKCMCVHECHKRKGGETIPYIKSLVRSFFNKFRVICSGCVKIIMTLGTE